ncbi:hypothetical protein EG329_008466 [Mollisiaceae sp. DMI_Dod_QoI]|nr:hypothetical protein EG329_008466 [Helotiales sp. DMI_Dod_QoI]
MTSDRVTSTAATGISSSASMNGNGVQSSSSDGRKKLHGRAFYESIGSPRFVLAPMVDQSEFAWRMLTRSFMPPSSPQDLLAYTPMLHARMFGETAKFRDSHFQPLRSSLTSHSPMPHTSASSEIFLDGNPTIDRPLFVQFCANDPEELLAAARYVQPFCDAIDLNLGCPQGIARKGKYGAFLQEDQDLIFNLINKLHKELDVPVSAKIRILDSKEKTLEYAQNVLKAGASILTVHARTREMKGHKTGLADWSVIKFLRESLPRETVMFANGNILRKEDITRCLEETGVDGVMSAEGNLYDPAIFAEEPSHGEEGREFWRGKDGKGGWRMDAVFRRYMDIIYKYVLETPPPSRTPLYLPSDPEPIITNNSNGIEKQNADGKRGREEEEQEPPKKRQKKDRKEKTTSPNLLAMQPHLFHLLRPLVAKHHNVRDALARSRAGDIAAFENVLRLTEVAVQSGLREYEDTNGRSWEREVEDDERLRAAKVVEDKAKMREEEGDGDGDGEMDESSVETVRACKRPWWVVQPYVRPLPKEALAKGSLTLSRKEKARLEMGGLIPTPVPTVSKDGAADVVPNGYVGVEKLGDGVGDRGGDGKDGKGREEVEIPKQGLWTVGSTSKAWQETLGHVMESPGRESREQKWTPGLYGFLRGGTPRDPSCAKVLYKAGQPPNYSLPFSNHDLELGQATILNPGSRRVFEQARTSPRQKETKPRSLAKRTFQVTLAFGILTLIYEAVSVLPAYHSALSAAEGVNLQVKSEADSRQALAYSFLQECENRKIQNLTLGDDCIINLAKTPKAPPDIDDWLMEAPASRLKAFMLMMRNIALPMRQTANMDGYMPIDTSATLSHQTWFTSYSAVWVMETGDTPSKDCTPYLSRKPKPPPSLGLNDRIGLAMIIVYIIILAIFICIQLRERRQILREALVVRPLWRTSIPTIELEDERSFEDVYSSVVKVITKVTRKIGILGLNSSQVSRSWRSNWTIEGKENLIYSDPSLDPTIFGASQGRKCEATISSNLETLTVKGILWDTIAFHKDFTTPCSSASTEAALLDIADLKYSCHLIWTAVLETLDNRPTVAAQFALLCTLLITGHHSQEKTYNQEGLVGEADMEHLLRTLFQESGDWPFSPEATFWGNLLFLMSLSTNKANSGTLVATKWGCIGKTLYPGRIQEGDVVCVLLGCPVPMVLRPMANHYEVIGDIYLHEIMFGEALEALGRGEVELQDFELH